MTVAFPAHRKRAFITGITGQDGSYLAELLISKNYEVHGIKRRSSSFNTERVDHLISDWHERDLGFFLHFADLSDATSLSRLLYRITPDEIYHLGAQSHVRVSFDIPEYTGDITALGTTRLLDAIRDTGIPTRFYNAASSEMFGQAYECPQTETTPFRPRSPYGCAKLYSYWMTVNAREGYGLYAVNGILFNHESPRRGEIFVSRKITRAVARILHGLQEKLYLGNLDGERDWGYAPEFVEGIWRMLQQKEPEDFLLATGETHSVREFVERAFAEVGLDWRRHVEVDPQYYRPTEIDRLEGDFSKARKKLGWAPATKFRDLVKIMVEADVQLLEDKLSGQVEKDGDARRGMRAFGNGNGNGNGAMGIFYGRRIVVTGGAGFLGRVVVRKLRERGCTDITVPRRAACDLSRWDHIEQLFDKCRPHLLLHLAATVDNPAGHRDVAESFYNNAMMAMQLMEASSRHGVEKMICIGSASSYPANAPVPLREQDLFKGLPDPARAVHGIAKRLPLIQAQAYRQQYGFHCVFLIPTNFYGPGDNFEPKTSYVIASLIRKFVHAVETGASEIVIGGTGCATRDFIHVDDCAEGILLALEHYSGGDAINLGSGAEVPIHELARKIAAITGYTGRIQWDPSYPEGTTRRVLDVTRAQKEFGFRARRGLSDGLVETVEWYRSTLDRRIAPLQKTALAQSV